MQVGSSRDESPSSLTANLHLLAIFFTSCAVLTSARPQQNSGYDYPAPQDAGVTGAFDSLRVPAGRLSSETGQQIPTFQQQLTSREAGFQLSSRETGGFPQGVPASGFGSQERGIGQQAGYDSSAELQIGLRQPGIGGSFGQGVAQSQQATSPAFGSLENVRGGSSQFQTGFGSRETGAAISANQPGLPSSEIFTPGSSQGITSGFRPDQGSAQRPFLPQQVPAGQAVGFPTTRQQPGQFSPQQGFETPTQQQPSQFGVGVTQPVQSGVSPTDFAGLQQQGQVTGPVGSAGTPQTQTSGQSPRTPGQDFPGSAVGGSSDDSHSAPAQYSFKWDVNDAESGNFYGHQEERDGALTQGRYYVTLPDTRVMTVEYYADETGYHPTITFEGEAQQFIPPPRQATADGGSIQGAGFNNQEAGVGTGFLGSVSAGLPGLSSGEIFQSQGQRGIGTQGQAQAHQQFASQTPTPYQSEPSQGIVAGTPQRGLGGSQHTTSAPGFSQTPGLGFGRPTQPPTSTLANVGAPQTGFFGTQQQPSLHSAQPGAQLLQQQPGFSQQQQQIPVSGQPQAGSQTFQSQPQQGQAFGGQPQLSSVPGSQIGGFSSAEQRGQSGFQQPQRAQGTQGQGAQQPQRIQGTQGQGVQQPDQLYTIPQQVSPSPGQQFVSRDPGSPRQSGEISIPTNFGQTQQPLGHSSGEVHGFQSQQPGQAFGQQPSQGVGQQPSQELGQQPSQGLSQQPSQGFAIGQQPFQAGLGQQPFQAGTGQQQTPGRQSIAQPFASSQEQVGPGFQQRTPSGRDTSTSPARPVLQRPTQLYGTPQA
ncbi:Insect cuticle protein [Trinorchestia longiramus]|nr:Insect cuticle protein [Trinorchestia longiramus]